MEFVSTKDKTLAIGKSVFPPSKFIMTIYHNEGTYIMDISRGIMAIHNYNTVSKVNEITYYKEVVNMINDYFVHIPGLEIHKVFVKTKCIQDDLGLLKDIKEVCHNKEWILETVTK
jgi:hypothetical protein